ncbi:MAG: sensor histidine kinase [Desulfovibrionaceae bacterium]
MLMPSRSDRLERLMAARVDELTRRNEKLEQALQARDAFLVTLSHDLRSPLAGQLALMASLLDKLDGLGPDQVRERVEAVHGSSAGLYNLLENLLQWTALRTGGVGLRAQKVELAPATAAALRLHRFSAAQKEVALASDVPEFASVFADRRVVETVLRNLVSNAVKFTPEGGSVRVGCRENGYKMRLEVSDTGPGLDEATLRRINRGDRAVPSAGVPGQSGAGLGLMLCNELLSRYGGRIEAASEPGQGSRLAFWLPKGG